MLLFIYENTQEYKYFRNLEKPVSFVFQSMEDRGIRIDLDYLKNLDETLTNQKQGLETSIKNELGNINLNSPKQLLKALQGKGLNPVHKKKPSTDKNALEKFKYKPYVVDLLKYSELDTLLGTFVKPYLERNEEIIHPSFHQCGTRTGRPSCSNPNLLNIPKRSDNGKLVRRMFIPRQGYAFGDCDFGQIEPRMLAHLSKDADMLKMFNDGTDFHTYTSERLSIDRERAKVLNLSVGYRATPASVSQQLKCSWEQAENEIDRWWSMFPNLYDWQQKLIHESKKSGYCTTLLGRRIKVENLDHGNQWTREAAERQLINNIAQGSAQEVMKLAMIEVHKVGISILIQVYDELLFESPIKDIDMDTEVVIKCMTECTKLDVPLVVDAKIGMNWSEAKA